MLAVSFGYEGRGGEKNRVDNDEWEKLGKREKQERNKGAQERGS